jgi:hypothetical protein
MRRAWMIVGIFIALFARSQQLTQSDGYLVAADGRFSGKAGMERPS